MNILIKGATIFDPANKKDEIADCLIQNGKIAEIGKNLTSSGETLDAKGMHLVPGFIDLHTHFREPGFEAKETIQSGAHAALRGGFVACVSMPNTNPPCDHQGVIDNIIRKAKEVPFHLFPSGTISKGREGKELSEMADLKQAGIVAVTDDGDWVADSLLMRRALEYANMLGLIVMTHAEDRRLSAGGCMNEGHNSTRLGLKGITQASEDIAVARDIELARLTKGRLHICHISTARAMDLVRRAKEEGLPVTAEVTPHHLTLSDSAVEGYNTNFKMNPPLRTDEDVKALRKGLKEGVIDCIATDHAPHRDEDKMLEFDDASFGVIGLETAFGIVMTELFHGEKWPFSKIIEAMAVRPAKILGLGPEFGGIHKGSEANLALVDISRDWTVTQTEIESKSRNSCFMNRKLKGKVMATICAGKLWKF
jgi:dihydroorotase